MDAKEHKSYILSAKDRQTSPLPKWRQCCATCEKLTDEGWCQAFEDYPPIDFIEQENNCGEYIDIIPF